MSKLNKIPKVNKVSTEEHKTVVPHLSYSGLCLFSENPVMFKIRHVNGDYIDSTMSVSGVIGQAFHHAMEYYWSCEQDDAEAMRQGLEAGMEFLENYNDGFIDWNKTVANKQKAQELLAFCYNTYVKEKPRNDGSTTISCEEMIKETINVTWKGQNIKLPIPLKGKLDRLARDKKGRLIIRDYKTCRSFSDPDKIDGRKIIQSIQYFFLVYVLYGEVPYSMIYEEVKMTKNRDGGKQLKEYEFIYEKNDLFFDFYLRLYSDVVRALSGEMVFVPNVSAMWDNEVAMIAYIHRLDMSDVQAAMMKKHKVDNLTALLQRKIQTAGNMRQLMKSVEKKFVSARNLNYSSMTNEQKIATKLMEHGILVQFNDKIDGATVELYRFTPSIGLKMARLKGFVDDIEQVLGISNIRILAPIPNSTMIGFEVPKQERYFPAMPEPTKTFDLNIGLDIMGETVKYDLREAPHMLVAGSTGSGKSVFLNTIIEQLLVLDNVDLHLFDPKEVEFFVYEDRVTQYHSDPKKINDALEDLVLEMEERYQTLKANKVRNINQLENINYKFVIIDEYNDLAMNSSQAERNILLLAQKSRAAGIHLIIATQRPSTDVISGTIKANFPVKAVFRVSKEVDSRVVLDESGAEKLAGKGDMLFSTTQGLQRVQGFNL